MSTYYKAVRPDGTDFRTGSVQWAPPEGHEGAWIITHPTVTQVGRTADEYLSVSTVATACTGMAWPCRLLEVETEEITIPDPSALPHKRGGVKFTHVRELDPLLALGPQGEQVAALIALTGSLTAEQAEQLVDAYASRVASREAVWAVARIDVFATSRVASREAVWAVAYGASIPTAYGASMAAAYGTAARDAICALAVRDIIPTEDYDLLTSIWRTTIGPIHPDDPDLTNP